MVADKRQENIKYLMNQVDALNATLTRASLLSGRGKTHNGDRELYEVCGYPETISAQQYLELYQREGTPQRVNNAPCDAVWSDKARVFDVSDDEKETAFESSWIEFAKDYEIWSKFNRVDKLLGFGRYSILLIGFDDVKADQDLSRPVDSGDRSVLYVQCFAESKAPIKEFEDDPQNKRFGQPRIYTVSFGDIDNSTATNSPGTKSLDVHYSRIIHIVEGNLENEIYGEPRLRRGYNRLVDLRKIVAGSGEMFWLGARGGIQAALQSDDYEWKEDDPTLNGLKTQIENFYNKQTRVMYTEGVDIKSIAAEAIDPLNHITAQLMDISSGYNIPKRLLVGSEVGELASTQDEKNWSKHIGARREWFANPVVLNPFIQKLIDTGVLPEPTGGEFFVKWPDTMTVSDKDKADVGRIKAEALAKYLSTSGAVDVVPPDVFFEQIWSMEADQIEELMARLDEAALTEEPIDESDPDLNDGEEPPEVNAT